MVGTTVVIIRKHGLVVVETSWFLNVLKRERPGGFSVGDVTFWGGYCFRSRTQTISGWVDYVLFEGAISFSSQEFEILLYRAVTMKVYFLREVI